MAWEVGLTSSSASDGMETKDDPEECILRKWVRHKLHGQSLAAQNIDGWGGAL